MLNELLTEHLAMEPTGRHIRFKMMRNTLKMLPFLAVAGTLPALAQTPDPQAQQDRATQQIQQQSLQTQQNSMQLQQQMQQDRARQGQLFSNQPPLFNQYTARPYGAPPRR